MLSSLYEFLIIRPLRYVYMNGPIYLNFGGWEGQSIYSICSQMSPQEESFWYNHESECIQIIDKKFYSYVSIIEITLYFYILHLLFKLIYYYVVTYWLLYYTHPEEKQKSIIFKL